MNILIDENLKIWKDSWKIRKNFIIISKVAFNYFYLLSLRILETREKFLEAEYPNRRKFENFNNSWKIREKLLVPSISMLDSFYFFFKDIVKYGTNPLNISNERLKIRKFVKNSQERP